MNSDLLLVLPGRGDNFNIKHADRNIYRTFTIKYGQLLDADSFFKYHIGSYDIYVLLSFPSLIFNTIRLAKCFNEHRLISSPFRNHINPFLIRNEVFTLNAHSISITYQINQLFLKKTLKDIKDMLSGNKDKITIKENDAIHIGVKRDGKNLMDIRTDKYGVNTFVSVDWFLDESQKKEFVGFYNSIVPIIESVIDNLYFGRDSDERNICI